MSMTATSVPAAGGYTAPAKVFHWLVALCVIGMIPVGLLLESFPKGPVQDFFFLMHKSTGFVVLVLMIGRIVWRFMNPPPPPEPTLARWQIGLSHAVHWSLYALLIAMPIVGWAGSNAYGAAVSVFGLFELPNLLAKDEPLSKTLFWVHGTMGFIILGLATVHIAAALHHRFVKKDAVLARMTSAPSLAGRG